MGNIIIGINSVYHESSACLIINNKVVAAIEEERLSRIKHAKEAKVTNPDELPVLAIKKCLQIGGIELEDVDIIGFSFEPERRLENINIKDAYEPKNWGSKEGELLFYDKLKTVPQKLRDFGFKGRFEFVEHSIAHAASAFYPSGFEDAAILSIDGIGEIESTTLAYGKGNEIKKLVQIDYPNSLGFLWEKFSKFLGYSEYDACKIMSIGSFGNPVTYRKEFSKVIAIGDGENDFFSIDKDIVKFRIEDYTSLETLFNITKRSDDEPILEEHKDIAATLQEVTTTILLKIVNKLFSSTKSKNLCMAGGVALNCVANRIIFENSGFENIYIQPAANDAGTALGAALKLHVGNQESVQENIILKDAYLGPEFSNEEIEHQIKSTGLTYNPIDNIEKEVAKLISEGKIVGWFQGAMEFGPRALGNRSLLADPRSPGMVKKLNSVVKHREDHRPFCPSVLAEEAENWFEIKKDAIASEYMLMAYPAKVDQASKIPAVVHVDGTSRIQSVQKAKNPRYHKLITEFFKLTGVPLLLNTSFNDREPIVCTPEQALKTFMKTNIDYLVMGDFLLSREENQEYITKERFDLTTI